MKCPKCKSKATYYRSPVTGEEAIECAVCERDYAVPKQIYIKTDMTEMPKGCKECREKGLSVYGIKNEWTIAGAHCFYRETSTTGGSSRPLWCPLVEIMEADEK